jgi:hypothetical protein
MCFVRVRLHKQGEQSEESLERYTVFVIESARMVLQPPVDTAVSFVSPYKTLANSTVRYIRYDWIFIGQYGKFLVFFLLKTKLIFTGLRTREIHDKVF